MISVTNLAPTAQTISTSENVLQDSNQTNPLYPPTPSLSGLTGRITCDPIIYKPGTITCDPIVYNPSQNTPQQDAALLEQAELLASDAYRKVSPLNPNVTLADKLDAQQELQQAEQLRNEVRPDLDPSQQQTLDQINSEEQQAVTDASNGWNIFDNPLGLLSEVGEMTDAGEKSQALENQLLGIPNPPPISLPIFPFGQIS